MFWKWNCLLQNSSVTLLTASAPAQLWSLHREPSPCPFEQTTIEILKLRLYCSDKTNNMEQYGMAKHN